MNVAEVQFWMTMRRSMIAVRKAAIDWYRSGEQSPEDEAFTRAIADAYAAPIAAIDQRFRPAMRKGSANGRDGPD